MAKPSVTLHLTKSEADDLKWLLWRTGDREPHLGGVYSPRGRTVWRKHSRWAELHARLVEARK